MTKKEMVYTVLQGLGYHPSTDDDGDIVFRYQMKGLYVIMGKEEEQYLSIIFPQFYEIEEGEDRLVLATCNKLTRDAKMAKVYIDQTFKHVSSACEFYYTDEASLRQNIDQSLQILGLMRSAFRNAKTELSE